MNRSRENHRRRLKKILKALEWYNRTGADEKKLKWLRKLKAEGHEVKMLDDEPNLSDYEVCIFDAVPKCKTAMDAVIYAKESGISYAKEFIDLVFFLRNELEKTAHNS